MAQLKETEFALHGPEKESIQERLKLLFRGRTLRRVAQDWGLPYSTLNNYFSKGAKPGLDVVEIVSKVEGVSIEWLVTGGGNPTKQGVDSRSNDEIDTLRAAWLTAYEFMNKAEAEALLRIIVSGGAKNIIRQAEHETSLDEAFIQLPKDMKERAFQIINAHSDAKKGASEESEVSGHYSQHSKEKQAS